MYVKGLRLAGFKSFANPTTLEFEAGVNVIVGPNGSGKSNIADSLQWVLGSQAPSSLRGASMEDVIFAGSATRPKLGMAEVSLTLDNSDRALPLDLAEVTISRSTDRNGTNEYRINGASCRLLDIQELLSDTGIGRSLHTIVGQGQLDAVLQARPEDRRGFIEEAAQIGKFRKRKDRSLRKIDRVEENLLRLNDVLVELRRAIRPLKRQAEAAAAYSELVARHRDLRQRLAATEVQRLRAHDASVDLEAEHHRIGLLAEELASVRAQIEGAGQARRDAAEHAESARRIADRISRAGERFAGLARLADERAERLGARLAAETEEGYRERIRLLEEERSRFGGELSSLSRSASEARSRSEELRLAYESVSGDLDTAEQRLGEARRAETAAAQDLVRAEGAEAAGRATIGAIEARVNAALERREVATNAIAGEAAAVDRAEDDVRAIERELDRSTEAAAEAETRLEAARERADGLRSDLSGIYAEVTGATARLDTLREVQELFSDRADVVARLEPLVTSAQTLVEVASQGESRARAVVEEADAAVERLWSEVARHDDELRRLDALMSGAAERLAGARRQREAREVELAALDDELARSRQALADAERSAAEERAALPARVAAVEESKAARVDAESVVSELRDRARSLQSSSSQAALEARSAEERSLACQLRVEDAEAGIADAQEALEGLAELRASLRDARERALLVAQAARLGAETAGAWARDSDVNAGAAAERARDAERNHSSLLGRERELGAAVEEASRKQHDAEVRRAETRARLHAIEERSLDEWGLNLDALAGLTTVLEDEESAARSEVEKLDREMRRLGAINPRASEEYEELAERERFLEAQMEDLRVSKRDLLKVVHEIDATIVEVFRDAYEDVAREFEGVFQRLFPGGTGRLKLLDPDDLLNSGIEIEARPPGKNVRKLSLLSGGERSLVALAFLFSIFRSRPSPFYLLDEVEAALDDINLLRFLGLVGELEEHAQILIVTHQKRTMEAADVLYGVSMNRDGVSHVIAKRLEEVAV